MRRVVGIHAVSAAVRAKGVDRVLVAKGARNPRIRVLVEECVELGVPVRFEPRAQLGRMAGTASHQNVVALLSSGPYRPLEPLLRPAGEARTIVVLDSVQDPRNLGAVIRTADAAGATAVVIQERRSAGLGQAAAKAAAGALAALPVVRVKNLSRALQRFSESDYWIYGFDGSAEAEYDRISYSEHCVLVFGSEDRGLRRKVAERCDFLVGIPLVGTVSSLNLSVAAGVALYEVLGQRRRDGLAATR